MVTSPERIGFREAESAFDFAYAQTMGMPADIDWKESTIEHPMQTVEDFFEDTDAFVNKLKGSDKPALYVLDSLDSLSDEAEMEREIGQGSYGAQKAKKLSEYFRRHATPMARANCTLLVISQIRDKIGVTFGETKTRSGGKALDFYCSQIIWLAETGKIKRTYTKVERVIGLNILVKNKKNKCGPSYREAELQLLFGYGIDDEKSMVAWLKKTATPCRYSTDEWLGMIDAARSTQDYLTQHAIRDELRDLVTARWNQVEDALKPPCRKYGDQ
jgi:recombination protein RecA